MANRLTDRAIKAAKPGAKTYELPDEVRGLVLRVHPSGQKTWGVRYRLGSKSRRLSIGDYPAFSLADARDRAAECRKMAKEGIDPAAKPEVPDVYTFSQAVDDWEAYKLGRGNRSVAATRQIIEKHALGRFGSLAVDSITRKDVHKLLCELRDRKSLGPQVNRVQTLHFVLT